MKHIVFALLAALALPCAASAQQGPPPGGGMMQMLSKCVPICSARLHRTARPCSRPSRVNWRRRRLRTSKAAAAQLDAALSPAEKQAILSHAPGHDAEDAVHGRQWGATGARRAG